MKQDKAALLIKKAALEFDKLSNAVLGQYGLTVSQYRVIKYLFDESDHGVRLADLEKFFSIAHPTAIGIVQNLEKKGLVGYAPNPNDARSRFIVPTEKAWTDRLELEAIGPNLELELTKHLSEEERLQLVALLRKMMVIDDE